MPTIIEKVKWLNKTMGVSFTALSKCCNCHAATLGRYVKGELVPTEKALRLIDVGLQQYMKELNEGMEM